jgi:hypothetical protein
MTVKQFQPGDFITFRGERWRILQATVCLICQAQDKRMTVYQWDLDHGRVKKCRRRKTEAE